MPADLNWNDEKGTYEDPQYSPDPYAHAVRHLDEAEDKFREWVEEGGHPATRRQNPKYDEYMFHLALARTWADLAQAAALRGKQ